MDDEETFLSQFKVVCRICGSEDIALQFDRGEDGSICSDGMMTGGYSARASFYCNACQNALVVWL